MSVTQQLRQKLAAAFGDGSFEIVDDSESHRGHGGYREGGESHFNVRISSPIFHDMNLVQRHRTVHAALGKPLLARIHALSLALDAPPMSD